MCTKELVKEMAGVGLDSLRRTHEMVVEDGDRSLFVSWRWSKMCLYGTEKLKQTVNSKGKLA